jgi:hypothetical protein
LTNNRRPASSPSACLRNTGCKRQYCRTADESNTQGNISAQATVTWNA